MLLRERERGAIVKSETGIDKIISYINIFQNKSTVTKTTRGRGND
jgi:hypothetical protein